MAENKVLLGKSEKPLSGRLHVIGFGAMNLDFFCRPESLVNDDETTMLKPEEYPGGSAANTIYALAKWGVCTGAVGVVAKDVSGSKLIRDMQKVEVDTSRVKSVGGTESGFVLCLSDRKGREALYVWPGANEYLELDDADIDYVSRASIIHLSSFVSDRQLELQKRLISVLPKSMRISFSPGAIYVRKGLGAISSLIERAEFVFLNHKQLNELTKKREYRRGAQTLIRMGANVVCVTFGKGLVMTEQGMPSFAVASYVRDGDDEHQEPARKEVKVLDAVGAGDAFAAGFLYGQLLGEPLDRCNFLGVEAAVGCVSKAGARDGLPSFEELAQKYEQKYEESLRQIDKINSL